MTLREARKKFPTGTKVTVEYYAHSNGDEKSRKHAIVYSIVKDKLGVDAAQINAWIEVICPECGHTADRSWIPADCLTPDADAA